MKNIKWIDFASVISAISVIFIHANSIFWTFSTDRYWMTSNIFQCFFYFAVPVFFMISGATLMNFTEKYDLKTYFSKRISKTLIPYIFWMAFAFFFQVLLTKQMQWSDFSFKMAISGFLTGRMGKNQIYWFFAPLFGIYLCLPLFASVPEKKKTSLFSYLCVTGFIVNMLIPFIISVFHLDISNSVNMRVATEYLIFPMVGYLVLKTDLTKGQRYMWYMIALAAMMTRLIGTYSLSVAAGKIDLMYWGYVKVPGVLQGIGAFIFLKYAGIKLMEVRWIEKFIHFLRTYTFSLYLLHWYFLQVLLIFVKIDPKSILYRAAAPFIVVPVCILTAWILRKIPLIKKILP